MMIMMMTMVMISFVKHFSGSQSCCPWALLQDFAATAASAATYVQPLL
jgi:hypothetical protein